MISFGHPHILVNYLFVSYLHFLITNTYPPPPSSIITHIHTHKHSRRRMGDGPFTDAMHVKKNKFVEEWNGRREITEQTFEVNPSNLPTILVMCLLIPYGIYSATRAELVKKGDPRYVRSGLI